MAQEDESIQIDVTRTVDKSTLPRALSNQANKAVQTFARLIGRQITREQFEREGANNARTPPPLRRKSKSPEAGTTARPTFAATSTAS